MAELSDVVKALHAHLREEVNSGQTVDEVWSQLLLDKPSLRAYSDAMSTLATRHWGQGEGDGSRVSWCVSVCDEYFTKQGDLCNLLLKDLRRKEHAMPTLVSLIHLPLTAEGVLKIVEEWQGRRLKMLDVGSCYNPFIDYPQFEVTAIDIAPANKSVMECDFLSVTISKESPEPSGSTCLTSLLTDSYDIVVFSLLLSFFPHPLQRLQCCCRAHKVLKLHGLLLLITPDSSHQNKHAPMMKAWKTCIQAIGFHRWKYWKDTHLHCMAFRKIVSTRQDYSELEKNCDLLYIPQDRHHLKPPNNQPSHSPQEDNLLSHLPFFEDNN